MSLSHKYINLKESYNQDIHEQVTTKNFLKKKTGFAWNPKSQRHSVQARCFQIQSPICYVKFSNNVSVRWVRVNERKTNLNQPLKSYNHHLPSLLDLIISPHVQHPPINLPKKKRKKKEVLPYFVVGEETLCFIFIYFPVSKSSSLQLWPSSKNYLATGFKVIQYGFWNFPNCFLPELQNHEAKYIKLGDQGVTNAPNLLSAICSEINTASNTNLILQQNITGSYKFTFSLKTATINWEKILQLMI